MNDLKQKLEAWANNLHHTDLMDGATEMLEFLWPVIEAGQVCATGIVQSDESAIYAGFDARATMRMALAELEARLEHK